MVMTRRIALVCALGVAVLVLATLDVGAEEGKDGDAVDWKTEVKGLWQRNCQNCHTAPDSQFETDRGYLTQIMETT